MRKISQKAYAKLNLTLDCLEKRPDGYHNLKSIMHPVDLYDTVTVKKTEFGGIKVNCSLVRREENLAFKAAKLFFETNGIADDNIEITVEKRIPLLSGLGGGSADAAAVINILNVLYGVGLTDEQKIGLAKKLGADVPFALFSKTALAEGIGEKLTFLENFPRMFFVLIKPCDKGSTGEMYKKLDQRKSFDENYTDKVLSLLKQGETVSAIKSFGNDFALCNSRGVYGRISEIAAKKGGIATSLTGSGPTCFSVFDNETDSTNFFNDVKQTFSFVSLAKSVG